MKKIISFFTFALFALSASAQFYQYKMSSSAPGYTFSTQPDITIDTWPVTPQLVSVIDENTGASDDGVLIMRYDLSSGMPLAGEKFTIAGVQLFPVRVLTFQGFTYVTGYTPTVNGDRFFFLKVNSTTNVVSFCRYFDMPGSGFNVRPIDVSYAGGGIFYITGDDDYGASAATFIAKLTFTGALTDYREIYVNGFKTKTCAMQYYASNGIYLSGVLTSNISPYQYYGFITTYDATTISATVNKYAYNASSDTMKVFKAFRSAKRIYVASESYMTSFGNAPDKLIISQLDAGTQAPLATTVYSAGVFRWTSRLNVVNGFITLSGYADMIDTGLPGFINAYFNLSTAYVTANRYPASTAFMAGFESTLDATGNIYSIGTRVFWSDTLFRIKGRPGNGTTGCDATFTFPVVTHSFNVSSNTNTIIAPPYSFLTLGTVVPTFFDLDTDTLCYAASRMANQETESNTFAAYPNPATNELKISLTSDESITAEIIDLTGRIISSNELSGDAHYTLSVADLPAGVYLLRIRGENRDPETVRFIKE